MKKHQPSKTAAIKQNKVPRKGHISVMTMKFRWQLRQADHEGPFGWESADSKTLFNKIICKLQDLESCTWQEVEFSSNGNNHFIDKNQWCGDAQARAALLGWEDEQLFSIRLEGRYRIWGRREDAIFQLLWHDPDHLICPSHKKNT